MDTQDTTTVLSTEDIQKWLADVNAYSEALKKSDPEKYLALIRELNVALLDINKDFENLLTM